MDDTISRRMAIDAVEFGITYAKAINKETGDVIELFGKENEALEKAIKRINNLPSAEPEIIRCKDCEYFSMTTLGMPYACWKGADKIFGETGEHANHTVCRRIDSPDWFCADGERRSE